MSQHFYKTTYKNRPVEVVMGWDRPTQEYFLWIEYSDLHEDEEEEFLWHSMDCHVAFPEEIAFILRVLTDFKIQVPSAMIRAVEEDCLQNVGNKEVIYAQPVEGDKTSLPDFNIGEPYGELVQMMRAIIGNIISGLETDKITTSNPEKLVEIDFEGEGLALFVPDELSNLERDLQISYEGEPDHNVHEHLKGTLIKVYQALQMLCCSSAEGKDIKLHNLTAGSGKLNMHLAYENLVEAIYVVLNIIGKAIRGIYFSKTDGLYLTSVQEEFVSKRAFEVLYVEVFKERSSRDEFRGETIIHSFMHKKIMDLLKCISEMVDSEKPRSSCMLF